MAEWAGARLLRRGNPRARLARQGQGGGRLAGDPVRPDVRRRGDPPVSLRTQPEGGPVPRPLDLDPLGRRGRLAACPAPPRAPEAPRACEPHDVRGRTGTLAGVDGPLPPLP